jgi:hypothetical protein
MRPLILDLLFKDDRMFVLEISQAATQSRASTATEKRVLAVVTRRNVPGIPPRRVDNFPTEAEAVDFYKKIVVTTPRVSLGEKPPEPTPTLHQYTSWLIAENLFDALLNPTAPQPDGY